MKHFCITEFHTRKSSSVSNLLLVVSIDFQLCGLFPWSFIKFWLHTQHWVSLDPGGLTWECFPPEKPKDYWPETTLAPFQGFSLMEEFPVERGTCLIILNWDWDLYLFSILVSYFLDKRVLFSLLFLPPFDLTYCTANSAVYPISLF